MDDICRGVKPLATSASGKDNSLLIARQHTHVLYRATGRGGAAALATDSLLWQRHCGGTEPAGWWYRWYCVSGSAADVRASVSSTRARNGHDDNNASLIGHGDVTNSSKYNASCTSSCYCRLQYVLNASPSRPPTLASISRIRFRYGSIRS